MRILLLAPQPFFQERGTTIAVDLLLEVFAERGDEVDVLTYHVGEDRQYTGVLITRIHPAFSPRSIRPGFSLAKLYCDLYLFFKAVKMARVNRYDVIHAVEEAGFIAMILSKLFRTPYVLDMDSSMSAQLVERFPWLRPISRALKFLEALPMRRAIAVIPMCEELAQEAKRHCSKVYVLKDVSLLSSGSVENREDLRAELGLSGPMMMYVGNLAEYQGIDLLLDTLVELRKTHPAVQQVIIGGSNADIGKYRERVAELGLEGVVHFIGSRPVAELGGYLKQADVLVSPRTQGTNTPMKIYSYLDSGVPVVATALPTHTQVILGEEAVLTQASAADMAAAIGDLLDNPTERHRLAKNAKALIQREHSRASFARNAHTIFQALEAQLNS